jgi:transcriptional regulator with XRE-family HTH domain
LRESQIPKKTQGEVAIAVGSTQQKISRIELGTFDLTLQDIRALCLYYQISADYLLELLEDLDYPKR